MKIKKMHLKQLKKLCNDAGIKLTHQRLEIFRELMAVSDHPSAELIHKRIHKKLPTIAIDTVYRTLATFTELGVVKKLYIMNERTLFDTNVGTHHHFICTRCKTIKDIHWSEFDDTMLPRAVGNMGKIESRHLEIHGICNGCLGQVGR